MLPRIYLKHRLAVHHFQARGPMLHEIPGDAVDAFVCVADRFQCALNVVNANVIAEDRLGIRVDLLDGRAVTEAQFGALEYSRNGLSNNANCSVSSTLD
jgi:hypothetical protein